MRLIDRDLLLSEIEKSREKNPHKDSKIRANHTIEHDHIAHLVLEQPTAYNVDKVVERLEKESQNIELIYPTDQGYDYEDAIGIDINKAKQIVKSGGIE
ncbi:hypothetical protein AALC75_02010 [Lachnospiraceae bacterium 48-42]